MPLIKDTQQVSEATLSNPAKPWRKMIPCDVGGGHLSLDIISRYIRDHYPEKLIYAEGDSWFDKFTPIPNPRTNLLQEIRLPWPHSMVVDVSAVGDGSGMSFLTRSLPTLNPLASNSL
jgi:hypothetical protein